MTPGARVAAAIEILDDMAEGLAAEQALTRWARRSRFAGSKDRAAIRDHVFSVLRCKRSAAHHGKGETGRALMIGLLAAQGDEHDEIFNGQGHAPAPLTPSETPLFAPSQDRNIRWNLPDWLCGAFEDSLGTKAEATAFALQERAPVCLRVNLAKATRETAQDKLRKEGIETEPNLLAETALTVTEGARKLRNTQAYMQGYVELQDAASQAVVEALPTGVRMLDYCSGGGGKALAMAATGAAVFAHDIDPGRMSDLPARAARAGSDITQISTQELETVGRFDVVLCDAPCSGSGSWRRAAEGKWLLTQEKLIDLNAIQDAILSRAANLVAPGGTLAFATCSVLKSENEDRIASFLAQHPNWQQTYAKQFDVDAHGDGFFTAHLKRV